MKSYTDLEQSKKLAEILPLESADMAYIKHSSSDNPIWEFNEDFPPMILGNVPINEVTVEALPCWSLAALLDVLPTLDDRNANFCKDIRYNKWHAFYHSTATLSIFDTERYDNLIDACYEMIIKLNELNLL